MAIEPIDMMVRAVLTGKSPLVMHSPRSADPEDDIVIQIKEIADKKTKQTAEDRRRKNDLQWRVCLYTEDVKTDDGTAERPVVPQSWLFRSLEAGGKALGSGTSSKGPAVARSVTLTDPWFPLEHDGPQDIAGLAADQRFRWRTFVNPNPTASAKRILPSVRPIFPQWAVTATMHLVTDMGLGWDDFEKAFRAAGNIGIGDARKLGYGRFSAKLTKLR